MFCHSKGNLICKQYKVVMIKLVIIFLDALKKLGAWFVLSL